MSNDVLAIVVHGSLELSTTPADQSEPEPPSIHHRREAQDAKKVPVAAWETSMVSRLYWPQALADPMCTPACNMGGASSVNRHLARHAEATQGQWQT
jgi:hypothetical protein